MQVSLTAHFQRFIEDVVASGRYSSSDDVIREGLRLLEEREAKLAELREAIRYGRESGDPVSFDPEAIKRRGRQRLGLSEAND